MILHATENTNPSAPESTTSDFFKMLSIVFVNLRECSDSLKISLTNGLNCNNTPQVKSKTICLRGYNHNKIPEVEIFNGTATRTVEFARGL